MVIFAVWSPNFLTASNLYNVVLSATDLALIAAGLTLVILLGGIDISVGSVVGLTAWIAGSITLSLLPNLFGLIAALAVGGLIGMLHGTIVSRFDVSPIIMSIGFLAFWRAVHVSLWGGSDLFAPPVTTTFSRSVLGIPAVGWVVLVVYAGLWFATRRMRFGRHIYAIGNDEDAAFRNGVPVGRTTIVTYAVLGMLVGSAGVVFMARTGVVQAFSGVGLELEGIAAVVVAGTSITGGRGSVVSTLGGVLFVAFLENGIVLLQVPFFWVEFLLGIFILSAVAIDARLKGDLAGEFH